MNQPIPFGKYLLLERISVGGMAEVFKAKSFGVEGFEKILAIKRILPAMSDDNEFIEMFIDEAKIAGQLSHANICQIFELGRINDQHFIAMEYVWGKDVLQIQNRFRRMKQIMPLPMAVFLAAKVCEGLDYAHHKKDAMGKPMMLIHRDVSPQNILVSYEGEVKLIDFGIAKAASRSSKTQAGVLKGKFGYMSPEQVRGLPLDRRSDIFAVGTMLYELMTGDRLFLGDSDFSTLEKVRNVDVQPPSAVNPRVPKALEKVVMRALARDPEDRYQWANEMQEELQAYLMTQESVYTSKHLSRWMKETFMLELKREQQMLEQYKKVGRDGRSAAAQREAEPGVGRAPSPPRPAGEPTKGAPPRRPTQLAVPVLKVPPPAASQRRASSPSPRSSAPPPAPSLDYAAPEEGGEATMITAAPVFADEQQAPAASVGRQGEAIRAASRAAQERQNPQGGAAAGVIGAAPAPPPKGDFAEDEPTVAYGAQAQVLSAPAAATDLQAEPTYILKGAAPLDGVVAVRDKAPPPAPPPREVPAVIFEQPAAGGNGAGEPQLVPALPVNAPLPVTPPPPAGPTVDTGRIQMPAVAPFAAAPAVLAPVAKKRPPILLAFGGLAVVLLVGGAFGVKRFVLTPKVVPVATGTLVVTGQPQRTAEVLVDGTPRGNVTLESPLAVTLPVGPHEIVIKAACCPEQRVNLTFAQAGEVRPVQAALKEPTPAQLKLTLKTEGATVVLDGAPVKPEELKAGIALDTSKPHQLAVAKAGFETVTLPLTPTPGEEIVKEIELKVARGAISVRSTPPGAEVLLNNKSRGQTPVDLDDLDLAKSYRVALKAPHFQTVTKTVSFPPSGETKQQIEEVLTPTDAEGKALLAKAQGGGADGGPAVAAAEQPAAPAPEQAAAVVAAAPVPEKPAAPDPAADKAARDQAKADKAAQAAADKEAREKAKAEKAEKAKAEKEARDQARAEKAEKAKAEKAARDQAKAEKAAADKEARERAKAEKAEKAKAEREAREKAKADKPKAEKVAASDKAKKPEKPEKPEKAEKPDKAAGKPCAGPGFLIANTQPWAKVVIDGRDTGLTTPIAPRSKVSLRAGKHRVTFVVGDKKFHFPVTITCGEDTRLIQKLPVQ